MVNCPLCKMPLASEFGVTKHYTVCKALPLPADMAKEFMDGGGSFTDYADQYKDLCGKGVIRDRIRFGGGLIYGDGGKKVIKTVQERAREASVAARTGKSQEKKRVKAADLCFLCGVLLTHPAVPESDIANKRGFKLCLWCEEDLKRAEEDSPENVNQVYQEVPF